MLVKTGIKLTKRLLSTNGNFFSGDRSSVKGDSGRGRKRLVDENLIKTVQYVNDRPTQKIPKLAAIVRVSTGHVHTILNGHGQS